MINITRSRKCKTILKFIFTIDTDNPKDVGTFGGFEFVIKELLLSCDINIPIGHVVVFGNYNPVLQFKVKSKYTQIKEGHIYTVYEFQTIKKAFTKEDIEKVKLHYEELFKYIVKGVKK